MNKFFAVFLGVFFLFSSNASALPAAGETGPDFTLRDTYGKERSLSDYRGKYVVLEWVNHDCPFVLKHYNSGNMQSLQKKYTGLGVVWLSVNSSAAGKQGHYPGEKWNELTGAKQASPTAVLLDPDGTVGRQYGAQTTPHIFIIDPQGVLIYQGAIDDIPSTDVRDVAKAKNLAAAALDEALAGKPVSVSSTKAYGCSVKY